MKSLPKLLPPTLLAFCGILTAVFAALTTETIDAQANSYYLYTKALRVDEHGVAAIPPRFKWSVETSCAGIGTQGNKLPDSRLMLRLYDPDQNFTAITAQMGLATAAKLHHDLGEIIVKILQNPNHKHQPQLYDPKNIPTGRFKGNVDKNGVLNIELDSNGVPMIELEDISPKQ